MGKSSSVNVIGSRRSFSRFGGSSIGPMYNLVSLVGFQLPKITFITWLLSPLVVHGEGLVPSVLWILGTGPSPHFHTFCPATFSQLMKSLNFPDCVRNSFSLIWQLALIRIVALFLVEVAIPRLVYLRCFWHGVGRKINVTLLHIG